MTDEPRFEQLPEDDDRDQLFADWCEATGHLMAACLNTLTPDVREVVAQHMEAGTAGLGLRATMEPTTLQVLLLDAAGDVVVVVAELKGAEPPEAIAH